MVNRAGAYEASSMPPYGLGPISRTRPSRLAGLVAAVTIGSAACVLLILAAAVILLRPTVARAHTQTAVTADGLHYSVNNSWILDPRRPADATVAAGLPARDAQLPSDQLLYAVFVGVTNETRTPRRMASDITLRDTRNVDYAPTRIARRNRFAYRPAVLEGKSHLPAPGTPADTNLSAGGLMLVFRISRRSYADGPLELVLHDPRRPGSVQTVQTT
jgi:hypothetical protein